MLIVPPIRKPIKLENTILALIFMENMIHMVHVPVEIDINTFNYLCNSFDQLIIGVGGLKWYMAIVL
jgi:hypothetical protein